MGILHAALSIQTFNASDDSSSHPIFKTPSKPINIFSEDKVNG
jgi:hypothetical protein